MPELPDLQVFSRNLDKHLSGHKLDRVAIANKSKLKTSVATVEKAFEGATLRRVFRSGKELRFEFDNGNILGMHLMLHGNLLLSKEAQKEKSTIAVLHFGDTILTLEDYQGAANLQLNPVDRDAPDALSDDLTPFYLQEQFARTRKAVKTVLMDQNVVRGIGNAYADEILWQAGIAPASVAKAIPADKIKELVKAVSSVLKDAIQQISKKDPDLIAGEVRDFLKIHNARKKQSPTGGEILHTTINARKTYYTEEQTVYE